jgi:hypothetical protein
MARWPRRLRHRGARMEAFPDAPTMVEAGYRD